MKNKISLRILSVFLTAVFAITAFSAALPVLISAAQTEKTQLTPIEFFKSSAIGGTDTAVVDGNGVFNNSQVAVISSSTEKKGIIADIGENAEADPSLGVVVTPFKGGNAVTYNSATVSHDFKVTNSLTSEKGVTISRQGSKFEQSGNVSDSQAYAAIQYTYKNSLVGADGIMFYLKSDSANTFSVDFSAFMPDNEYRWKYTWNPIMLLGVGKEYSYMPIGSNKWTTATAVRGRSSGDENYINTYFGAMKFNGAFEGYVKIPIASLVNDSDFVLSLNQDAFYQLTVHALGVGGEYGTVTAGPFFAVNSDSNLGKITVNNTSPEYPHDVGGLITGFEESSENLEGLMLYVKTDSANRISIKATFKDDYLDKVPDLQLDKGVKVYALKKGGSNWETIKTISTEREGAIVLDSAFEGYIKVPLSSMTTSGLISSPAVLPEISKIVGVKVLVAGIGGSYGTVQAAPFLITKDTDSTSFALTDGWTPYDPAKAAPIEAKPYNFTINTVHFQEMVKTAVTPLDFTTAKGISILPKNNATKSIAYNNVVSSVVAATTEYDPSDLPSLDGVSSVIMYVKTESANNILPIIEVSNRGNISWVKWDVQMSPAVGSTYYYASVNDTVWKEGTVTASGHPSAGQQVRWGLINFDSAFEGYIKIPLSALSSDTYTSGVKSTDTVARVVSRLQFGGGEYGTSIVGPYFYVTSDSTSTKINVPDPDPVEVTPLTGWTMMGSSTVADKSLVNPIDKFADAQGVKFTSKTGEEIVTAGNLYGSNIRTQFWYKDNPSDTAHELYELPSGFATSSLLLYVKTDSANKMYFAAAHKGNYSYYPTASLKIGSSYQYAALTDKKWTEKTVIGKAASSTTHYGYIEFDSAFEGYVKIPYASLGVSPHEPIKNAIAYLETKFEKLGGKYGDVVVGPVFYVDKDSDSTKLKLTGSIGEENKPVVTPEPTTGNPYDKIKWIFENSKSGAQQGYYFMVGDSTRHEQGYPVFRLVRHELVKRYNMDCTVQALSGLKARHWSGYEDMTSKGQKAEFTVDKLIEQIKAKNATGKGCIVDIALGINDSWEVKQHLTDYLKMGIDKIRAACPEVVIVYTSPNVLSDDVGTRNLRTAANAIWQDKSIYAIDTLDGVFSAYFSSYYRDTVHPNVDGYRQIAKYILTKYCEDLTFEKITKEELVSVGELVIPNGATLIKSGLVMSKSLNLSTKAIAYDTNQGVAGALEITGTNPCSGKTPFNTSNFVETHLSEPLNGYDYIAFHIDIPSANRIGLTAFTDNDTTECIFKNFARYYVMADGTNQWKAQNATDGRKDGSETYGSIHFDGAFSGWIKAPLSGFYGGPTNAEDINKITMRFSELGGGYGKIRVGAFIGINDEPYTAKNVWKKSNLPEMVPFTPVTGHNGFTELSFSMISSPIPTLTANKALKISSTVGVDTESYLHHFWARQVYDKMPIGNFTHIMVYVKVPQGKDNLLTICMFNDVDYEFKTQANTDYALLKLGSNEWEHYLFEKYKNQWGGIRIPAGFEGFLKIPVNNFWPANRVKSDTVLCRMEYRFSYIGSDENSVLVGPVFGVTKDNDPGPGEMVYTELPAATTIKSLYAPDEGDIYTDSIMLYWEKYTDAHSYLIEAYSITKTETGYEYRLAAKNTAFTNSGAVTGLMPNREYAILVKAIDKFDNVIAIYDYTIIKTLDEEIYKTPLTSEKIVYNKVYYPVKEAVNNGGISAVAVIAVCGGAVALLAALAVVIILVVKKRRKKNA